MPVLRRRRATWTEQDTTRWDVAGLAPAETAARREHARVNEWLQSLDWTPESCGLIHGDFERTNFMLAGAALRLYDFDDACYHWYLADVAHALWAFRNAPRSDRRRFLTWFLEGYRERSVLEADVREHLSWFVRLRSLSLFLNRTEGATARGRSAADELWASHMRAAFEKPFTW